MHLRAATPADAELIAEYNARLAWETEARALDRPTLLAGVRALLTDPAKGRYFVAEQAGTVVGQVMLTYEWSDWRNGLFWWLQSVYVHADFRSQGVFRALFEHVTRLASQEPGVCGLRLYVEQENERAKGVYVRHGMVNAGYEVFETMFGAGCSTSA
jgi:ribosomal protein S18 acetylase RimI-like enzyme